MFQASSTIYWDFISNKTFKSHRFVCTDTVEQQTERGTRCSGAYDSLSYIWYIFFSFQVVPLCSKGESPMSRRLIASDKHFAVREQHMWSGPTSLSLHIMFKFTGSAIMFQTLMTDIRARRFVRCRSFLFKLIFSSKSAASFGNNIQLWW